MTDQSNQEPTMEEILASIRRIISEDDPPPAADEAPPHGDPIALPEEPVAAAGEPFVFDDDEPEAGDVLELTERVDPEPPAPVESVGDLDVFSSPAPAPAAFEPEPVFEPAPAPAAAFAPPPVGAGLVSPPAASSAASAFASLSQSISMPRDGRTLEDVVRELLRPLLSQWLDENLPRIVETAVKAEVERIARGS